MGLSSPVPRLHRASTICSRLRPQFSQSPFKDRRNRLLILSGVALITLVLVIYDTDWNSTILAKMAPRTSYKRVSILRSMFTSDNTYFTPYKKVVWPKKSQPKSEDQIVDNEWMVAEKGEDLPETAGQDDVDGENWIPQWKEREDGQALLATKAPEVAAQNQSIQNPSDIINLLTPRAIRTCLLVPNTTNGMEKKQKFRIKLPYNVKDIDRLSVHIAKRWPVINLPNFFFRINANYPECQDNDDGTNITKSSDVSPSIFPLNLEQTLSLTNGHSNGENLDKTAVSNTVLNNHVNESHTFKNTTDSIPNLYNGESTSLLSMLKFPEINFENLHSHPNDDENKPINLVVLIHTAPANFKNRMAIRRSWGSVHYIHKKLLLKRNHDLNKNTSTEFNQTFMNPNRLKLFTALIDAFEGRFSHRELVIRLLFLTASLKLKSSEQLMQTGAVTTPRPAAGFDFDIYHGTQQTNRVTEKLLRIEASKYRDIVQGSFLDSYQNLTYKMIMGFKWVASRCPNADYILKMDDDIFVNPFALYVLLNKFQRLKGLFDVYKSQLDTETDLVTSKMTNQPLILRSPEFEQKSIIVRTSDLTYFWKRLNVIPISNSPNELKNEANWITSFDRLRDFEWAHDVLKSFIAETATIIRNKVDPLFAPQSNKTHADETICEHLNEAFDIIDHQNPLNNMLICNVWVGMPILRDQGSKWYVSPEEFNGTSYPPYCSGWAILAPRVAAYKLMYRAPAVKYFWIDDVHVTGTIVRAANLTLTHINQRFTFGNFADERKSAIEEAAKTSPRPPIPPTPKYAYGPIKLRNVSIYAKMFPDAIRSADGQFLYYNITTTTTTTPITTTTRTTTVSLTSTKTSTETTTPMKDPNAMTLDEYYRKIPTLHYMFGPVGDDGTTIQKLWEETLAFYEPHFTVV